MRPRTEGRSSRARGGGDRPSRGGGPLRSCRSSAAGSRPHPLRRHGKQEDRQGAHGTLSAVTAGHPGVLARSGSELQSQGNTLCRARVRPGAGRPGAGVPSTGPDPRHWRTGGAVSLQPARPGKQASGGARPGTAAPSWRARSSQGRRTAGQRTGCGLQSEANRGWPHSHSVSTGATPSGRHHLLSWAGTEMATSVPSLQVPTARATGLGEELEQSTSAWCGRRVWVEAGPHVLPSCPPPCHDPEERGREAGCGGRGGAACGKRLAPVSSAFQKTQIKKMMK